MNIQRIKKNSFLLFLMPIFGILIFLMCALSSIFFKTYLKTLFHYLGISQIIKLSESNTYPFTILLLFTALFLFVIIRRNVKASLLSFLIFFASYGIYGYLFATIQALGFFTKPLLPSLLIASFLGSVVVIKKIKALLNVKNITPGVQNLIECSLWTSIFLVFSKMFYPLIRPDLINFAPFTWTQRLIGLSEASIFFGFFAICLSALICLVILQSPKWDKLFKRC